MLQAARVRRVSGQRGRWGDTAAARQHFNRIALALGAFRHHNGHFAVPYNWKVPSTTEWPDETHRLALGRRLQGLMQHLSMLKRQPDTFKLQTLKSIGFPVEADWWQYRWQTVTLPALQTYKRIHGNLLVPRSFVVPSNDSIWPKATWNLPLGVKVGNLRNNSMLPREFMVESLENLGFVWHVGEWRKHHNKPLISTSRQRAVQNEAKRKFELFVKVLAAFKRQEGHFLVPYHFTVPPNDQSEDSHWPMEARGMRLGRKLHSLAMNLAQHNLQDEFKLEALQSIGFPTDRWPEYSWRHSTIPALKTYKRLYGDLLVPYKFVVPYGDQQWPRSTWGLSLGRKVNDLRTRCDLLSMQQEQTLTDMEFVWNVTEWNWHHKALPALIEFKHHHGHMNVPKSFVIGGRDQKGTSTETTPWPKELCGFRLGDVVERIRYQDQFMYLPGAANELARLGVSQRPMEKRWSDEILPALEMFREVFHHCNVPRAFVVPSESPWPPSAWGLRLGHVVHSIRHHDGFRKQIARDHERWAKLDFQMRVRKPRSMKSTLQPQSHTLDEPQFETREGGSNDHAPG